MTYIGIASLIGMKGKLKLWTFCLETAALQYMVSQWRTCQILLIVGGHVPGENSNNEFHDMNVGPPVHVHATWKKKTTTRKWIDRKHGK